MQQFNQGFSRVIPTLIAAAILMAPLPLQAATPASGSGPLVLAQKAEPKPEAPPCPPAAKPAPAPARSMAPPPTPEKMEEKSFKKRGLGATLPEASGTKKMGGQTIRAKESPEAE